MSELVGRLEQDLKAAVRARDKERVGVLRMLLAKIKDQQIAQGRGQPLAEAQVLQILAAYAKQRQEAADAFAQAGRADLQAQEVRERDIVRGYLPAAADDDTVRAVLREIIAATGAAGPRDLGKVMGPAMGRLQGRADGGVVQRLAHELLGG